MTKKHQQFKDLVMKHYVEHGRHNLPWRLPADRQGKNISPYRVVVSEIMLQQTQVDRVVPFFKKWMLEFPSWRALSEAKQSKVLKLWKGLGYNSRALRLHTLAKLVVDKYSGRLPRDYNELVRLPGIGPYTAGAVRAFAWNEYTPIIETNIRRIFIHHFFKGREEVGDREIFEVMEKLGEIENPREWYMALMDYGATLPKAIKHNPNKQSKHYIKQSKFQGSDRQIRGKILEILLEQKNHKISEQSLLKKLSLVIPASEPESLVRIKKILKSLKKEGFIEKQKKSITLR